MAPHGKGMRISMRLPSCRWPDILRESLFLSFLFSSFFSFFLFDFLQLHWRSSRTCWRFRYICLQLPINELFIFLKMSSANTYSVFRVCIICSHLIDINIRKLKENPVIISPWMSNASNGWFLSWLSQQNMPAVIYRQIIGMLILYSMSNLFT